MEAALGRLTGERIAVIGASRTDAGAHAEGQVANFHTASRPAEDAARVLESGVRAEAGPAAPALGLCLLEVRS